MSVPLSLIFAAQSVVVVVAFAVVIWLLTDQQHTALQAAIFGNIDQRQAVAAAKILAPFAQYEAPMAGLGERLKAFPSLRCEANTTHASASDYFNTVVLDVTDDAFVRFISQFAEERDFRNPDGNPAWGGCTMSPTYANIAGRNQQTTGYITNALPIAFDRLQGGGYTNYAASTTVGHLRNKTYPNWTPGEIFPNPSRHGEPELYISFNYPLAFALNVQSSEPLVPGDTPMRNITTWGIVLDLTMSSVGQVASDARIAAGSKVMLFELATAQLLATSLSIPLLNGNAPWGMFATPDREMNAAAKEAMDRCPYTSTGVGAISSGLNGNSNTNGGACTQLTYLTAEAVVSVHYLATSSDINMMLLQLTPEYYFFGESRKTRLNGILVGAGAAVIVLITCVIIWLAVHRPLRILRDNMELAAIMQNERAEPNPCFLREIASLNDGFERMNSKLLLARAYLPQALLVGEDEEEAEEEEERFAAMEDDEMALLDGGDFNSSRSRSRLGGGLYGEGETDTNDEGGHGAGGTRRRRRYDDDDDDDEGSVNNESGSAAANSRSTTHGNSRGERRRRAAAGPHEDEASQALGGMGGGARRGGGGDDRRGASDSRRSYEDRPSRGAARRHNNSNTRDAHNNSNGYHHTNRRRRGGDYSPTANDDDTRSQRSGNDKGGRDRSSDGRRSLGAGSDASGSRHSYSSRKERDAMAEKRYTQALTRAMTHRRVAILVVNGREFHRVAVAAPLHGITINHVHHDFVELMEGSSKAEKGVIDGFQGDHFVITFNAALSVGAPAKAAALCAIRIQNSVQHRTLLPGVTMGLSAGLAMVGSHGSSSMKRFGTISPAYAQAVALEVCAKSVIGVASCLFSTRLAGDLDTHIYSQIVGQKALGNPNISTTNTTNGAGAAAEPAPKPVPIAGVMSPITTQGDEWLYELQEGVSKNPYARINAAYELFFAGRLDVCEGILAQGYAEDADPCLAANWHRLAEIISTGSDSWRL